MFSKLHQKLNKKMYEEHEKHDKLYGTTTVGAKGQVVIPAEARKDLGIQPGDQLVVMGKFGKALGLMKTDQLTEFVEMIMTHMEGTGMEKHVKVHIEKLFKDFPIKKSNYK